MILATHVHLWIGTTTKEQSSYNDYFELDYSIDDVDDPNYKISDFAKDLRRKDYYEEFLFYPAILEQEVDIGSLLETSLVDESEFQNVINKCKELGITKANANFNYTVPDIDNIDLVMKITKPYEKSYNDLQYIGMFLAD